MSKCLPLAAIYAEDAKLLTIKKYIYLKELKRNVSFKKQNNCLFLVPHIRVCIRVYII